MRAAIATLTILSQQAPVQACPFCATETGNHVREGIFNDGFALNVILTLIPFPVLFAIVALVYLGPPRRPRSQGSQDE
jgi:hypothetical protein